MFDLNASDEELKSKYGLRNMHPTDIGDVTYFDTPIPEDLSDLTPQQQYELLIKLVDLNQPSPSQAGDANILLDLIIKQDTSKSQAIRDSKKSLSQFEHQVHKYNEDLKKIIESNSIHFINTKWKIDNAMIDFMKLKTKAQQDRASSRVFNPQRRNLTNKEGLTAELEDNINSLQANTSSMIQPIIESKAKEDKVVKMIEFTKANQNFFDLPNSLVHSLSLNNNEKFIDDYNRYIHDKDRFLSVLNNRYRDQVLKLTHDNINGKNDQALRTIEDDRKLQLTLILKVFKEIDTIAHNYRNKIYQEFLSLDHEASKTQSTSKFMSLVDNLSRLNLDDKMKNPIADFLTKQIEAIDKDFEYQVEKFDSKFLLMQNKLIDYIGSLNPERREGSHINYINEKYDTYKDEINSATINGENKLMIIKEAFESNDSLDLSLINEAWLVLFNFINYLDNMVLSNLLKFLNNYVHYIKLGIDSQGKIRDSAIELINKVVVIMMALFDDENNNNNNNNNNKEKNNSNPLESSPKNYKQFVPYYTNSLSTIYHLTKINRIVNKIINNFGNFVGTIGNISQYSETNKVMKSLKNSSTKINQKILEAICATWVNDCSQFYELEDWTLDKQNNKHNNNNNKNKNNNNNSGNAKCTKLMNVIQCYQLYVLLKISNLVIHDQSSDYNVVAVYPSKRMLVSIEIQFMRSLNIIVDSMMKKYNLDRQISQQSSNNMDDSNAKNLQVFKILTMNNFDKLSRIIYPELLLQFDKFFDKDLLKQNLKLFADIDKASLTIIDDILNIEKLYIAQTVNKFFHTTTGAKAKAKGTNISYTSPQVLKVDGFVYEILIHFVKLINKIKPLTNEEVFVTIINELQLNLLKNILDNTRQILLKLSLAYVNLKLDANFILLVFEKSKLLQLNDSSYKILQILLNEIDNKNNELFNDKNQQFNYSKKDFDEILQLNMQDSANEFSCF